MTPRMFWRTTPRKFQALCLVHKDLNSSGEERKDKQVGVGRPDTFIDQLPI